jgi:hypothetical protein
MPLKLKLPNMNLMFLFITWVATAFSTNNRVPIASDFKRNTDSLMYNNAIAFLNGRYPKSFLTQACEDCRGLTNRVNRKEFDKLNVSKVAIESNLNCVVDDLLRKKYRIDPRMASDSTRINDVYDSISKKISDYKRKFPSRIGNKFIDAVASNYETGGIVFFSNIFEYGLSCEVKIFCVSYKQDKYWQGGSEIYHFVFDSDGRLKEVYEGRKQYD